MGTPPDGGSTKAYQPPPVNNDPEIRNQPANPNPKADPETESPSTLQYSPQEKAKLIAEKQAPNNLLEDELRRRFGTNTKHKETEIEKTDDREWTGPNNDFNNEDHDFPAMANTVGS